MREEYSQQHHSWNEIRKGGRSTSALQTSADSASLDLVTSTLPKDPGPVIICISTCHIAIIVPIEFVGISSHLTHRPFFPSIAANSSTTVSSSVRVGPDPATVKQLAILAAFATMRMVVKRWKHVQSDAQAAGPLDPASDSVSVAGSPLFPDPLKTPRTSPKAVGSADGPPMANPSDSHKRSSSTSSSSTLALGNVSGSSFIPPVAATAPAMERQLPRQVARSYQSTNAQSQSRPAPAFAAPAPVTPFYPSLPTTHSGSSSLSSSHPMLAPGMRGMLGVPAYAATPTPSIASGSSSSSSTSRTPSLYSASSVHSANTTTTTATCTPEEKAFLNAYSQRHATHLHTLATSSLTVLALPYHAVILALLFVKRLLALPEVPAALCTPTKLLLAGLVLADAELCDSTVSMRTWAAVTGARGGGAQVAEIKRAALAALQFCVTVDADTYSAWLLNVKSFFREDGSSGATSVAGVSLPQSQSLGTTVAPLPSSSSSASGGASTVPGPLVVGGVGHQPPSSLAPVAVSVVGKAEVPGNGQTVDPVAVYGGRGMGTFCV
ncbi:hypothetical protein DFJ73DRAFT_794073 [Zopfochytrium polystomum]|nr:hypothetical protein DFJ73DRAFT_794073 [Zopfochytrium polystomum]